MRRILFASIFGLSLSGLASIHALADQRELSSRDALSSAEFYYPLGSLEVDLNDQTYYLGNDTSPHAGGVGLEIRDGKRIEARTESAGSTKRTSYSLDLVSGALTQVVSGWNQTDVLTTIYPGNCDGGREGYLEAFGKLTQIVDSIRAGRLPIFPGRHEVDNLSLYLNGILTSLNDKCGAH